MEESMDKRGRKKKGGILQRLGLDRFGRKRSRSRSRSRSARREVQVTNASASEPAASSTASSSRAAPQKLMKVLASTEDAEQQDLRAVVAELYLSGTLNAKQSNRLARAGKVSGAGDVEDLAKAGAFGTSKNTSRDLMRSLLRGTHMPPLYYAEIPIWMNGERSAAELPFLLPHEVVSLLSEDVLGEAVSVSDAMPELRRLVDERKEAFSKSIGSPVEHLAPIGLHGDGVPVAKKASLEIISWNFASMPMGERVVFGAIGKQWVCQCACKGRHTWDAVLDLFSYSMRALQWGTFPALRHDGQPFQVKADKWRVERSAKPLPIRGALCQLRADWPFLKVLFGFPQWTGKRVCWRCCATQQSFRVTDLSAPWRSERLTMLDFLAQQREAKISPSPLLRSPLFTYDLVAIDWLHTMDLGVTQDIGGSLLYSSLRLQEGSSRQAQLKCLWEKIKAFYQHSKPSSRLDHLTEDMLWAKSATTPKLKAKGGETRYLVPFFLQLARENYKKEPTAHWNTVLALVTLLWELYLGVSQVPFDAQQCAEKCRRMCVLYAALAKEGEQQSSGLWRMKPKVHLAQELLEFSGESLGSPQNFWTYRDESWMGQLALAAHPAGGPINPATITTKLLQRYRAMVS
jgi:hypothetical protein